MILPSLSKLSLTSDVSGKPDENLNVPQRYHRRALRSELKKIKEEKRSLLVKVDKSEEIEIDNTIPLASRLKLNLSDTDPEEDDSALLAKLRENMRIAASVSGEDYDKRFRAAVQFTVQEIQEDLLSAIKAFVSEAVKAGFGQELHSEKLDQPFLSYKLRLNSPNQIQAQYPGAIKTFSVNNQPEDVLVRIIHAFLNKNAVKEGAFDRKVFDAFKAMY